MITLHADIFMVKHKPQLTYRDLLIKQGALDKCRILGIFLGVLFFLLCITSPVALALTFKIPENSNIVGDIQVVRVREGESLGDIGRRFDLGIYEMIEANPNLNPWAPTVNAEVIIPTKFILPNVINKGLVINLAEMRIYYFHHTKNVVSTYPIGIGKKGSKTPLGNGKIIEKQRDPTWYPPDSIREEHSLAGDILPAFVPPGPDNPLGAYALRLSIPGYLIHGTNRPGGIGVRSSNGCIRLFPEDIETLFYQISINDPVYIIHAPYKFGFVGKHIFVESHQPLSDSYYKANHSLQEIKLSLYGLVNHHLSIDWNYTLNAINKANGYPILIPQL